VVGEARNGVIFSSKEAMVEAIKSTS